MASFAGSLFKGPTITGGPPSRAGSAAGAVDLSNAYGSLAKNANFDDISATAIALRAQEKANVMGIVGDATATGITAFGQAYGKKILGEARKDVARDMASANNTNTAFKAIGTIGGLALGLSDESTKDNIQAIDDALEKLRNLKPVTFHYKEEWSTSPERMHHGFIAQDFQKVVPDATYYDDEADKLCIDTGDLIGLLVRAIQQLETRVARMEAVNALAGVK